jgi:hypothetical protein
MSQKDIQCGDIVLASFKSSPILRAMKLLQPDDVTYSHILLAKEQNIVYEARTDIKEIDFSYIMNKYENIKVVSYKLITDKDKEIIKRLLKDLIGRPYSYLRLFYQLLDHLTGSTYFTSRLKDPGNQICSSLVSWIYYVLFEIKFNNKNWYSTDPDDIDDEVNKDDKLWHVVYKK